MGSQAATRVNIMTLPSPPVHSPPKTLEQAPTELLLTISRPLPARQSDPRVLTSYPYTPLYLLQAAWYNPTRKTAQREGIIVLLGASSSTKMNAYVKVYKENSGPFVAEPGMYVQVKERSSNPRWVRSSNPKWGQCSRCCLAADPTAGYEGLWPVVQWRTGGGEKPRLVGNVGSLVDAMNIGENRREM